MSLVAGILDKLVASGDAAVLGEVRAPDTVSIGGSNLHHRIEIVRRNLRQRGMCKGDRCAILASNSINWAAVDLAIMAEGAIAVPFYTRQAPHELVEMLKDADPRLICCDDPEIASAVRRAWPDTPPIVGLTDFVDAPGSLTIDESPVDFERPVELDDSDPVTIIYTSGTSGVSKGVVLTAGNIGHMLSCTTQRLDAVLADVGPPQCIFHYLPFCFCGSWIMLLTSLSRGNLLMLSTDLDHLRDELRIASPHLFMNVPTLLERVRRGVDDKLATQKGLVAALYRRACRAWKRVDAGQADGGDRFYLKLAAMLIFRSIRRKLSPRLKALVCGSAPLSEDTQQFFHMIGMPVYQVYGLTETTAICTMDAPGCVRTGRVGRTVDGVQMRLDADGQILVRGPNIFAGYWNRPDETANVFQGNWFCTGDLGEVDDDGNWRIAGRIKNLIVLNSGHNIAPEPIEDALHELLPTAAQVVAVGNSRSFLSAIVTGMSDRDSVTAAIDRLNIKLPHYKRIRAFHLVPEPFTARDGLITANGKLRRDAIATQYATQIEQMYQKRAS